MFEGQPLVTPTPIEVDEDSASYKIANILDSRLFGQWKKLRYQVGSLGFEGTSEHITWVDASNVAADEVMPALYLRHPFPIWYRD